MSARIQSDRDELIAMVADAKRLTAQGERLRRGLAPGQVNAPPSGQGMDFSESRPWVSGDDARNMDWRVTARSGKPHTKLFEEDRDQPWFIVVDQRPSLAFGTRHRFKSVQAARIAALLAWAGHLLGSRVAAGVITADGITRTHSGRSRAPVLELIGALSRVSYAPHEWGSQTDIDLGLFRATLNEAPRGCALFIVSDYIGLSDAHWDELAKAARSCVTIGLHVVDALETDAPAIGRYPVRSGSRVRSVTLADKASQDEWRESLNTLHVDVAQRLTKEGARSAQFDLGDDQVAALSALLTRRKLA